MSESAIPAFNHATGQAQEWVRELGRSLGWHERRAMRLLRSVLHALRDLLTIEEVADLSAQLPLLLRGVYFEGWQPTRAPARHRKKEDFIARIAADFRNDPIEDTEAAVEAVFALLDRHISEGEISEVRNAMKKPLRELWPGH